MATKEDRQLERMVKKYLRVWRVAFRLPTWPVFFQPFDEVKDRWGNSAVMGIRVDTSNAEVTVAYRHDLVLDEDTISRLVCHEMLHWVLGTLDDYVEEHLSKRSYRIHTGYIETAIETIALAFVEPDRDLPMADRWYRKVRREQ